MVEEKEEEKGGTTRSPSSHSPLRQKHKLLILEDNVLLSLGRHTLFVQEFPFLSKLEIIYKNYGNNFNKGCGCGGGRGGSNGGGVVMDAETKRRILNEIKKEIISLSQEKKNKFKEMLNTELVRIFYLGNDGKVTIETF
jgi:hypothetical protein